MLFFDQLGIFQYIAALFRRAGKPKTEFNERQLTAHFCQTFSTVESAVRGTSPPNVIGASIGKNRVKNVRSYEANRIGRTWHIVDLQAGEFR